MANVPRPDPTFLGYIAKRVVSRPAGIEPPTVELICSASGCISSEPESKFELWGFNGAGCYDREGAAIASVDPPLRQSFTRMALDYFPLEFSHGSLRPMSAATFFGFQPLPDPRPAEYAFLGYDAVSGRCAVPATNQYAAVMAGFDCSPLSCNGEAPRFGVNRYCLIDDWDEAVRAATTFARGACEPGPYYILGIYAAGPVVPNEAVLRGACPCI